MNNKIYYQRKERWLKRELYIKKQRLMMLELEVENLRLKLLLEKEKKQKYSSILILKTRELISSLILYILFSINIFGVLMPTSYFIVLC